MPNRNDSDAVANMLPNDPEVPIRLATYDQYRSLLFSVAYRMLGRVADAEDMLLQIRQPCHKSRPYAVFCLGCKVRPTRL